MPTNEVKLDFLDPGTLDAYKELMQLMLVAGIPKNIATEAVTRVLKGAFLAGSDTTDFQEAFARAIQKFFTVESLEPLEKHVQSVLGPDSYKLWAQYQQQQPDSCRTGLTELFSEAAKILIKLLGQELDASVTRSASPLDPVGL